MTITGNGLHVYACRVRAPADDTVPRGWTLVERGVINDNFPGGIDTAEHGFEPYGCVGYFRRLSQVEIEAFDLVYVGTKELAS